MKKLISNLIGIFLMTILIGHIIITVVSASRIMAHTECEHSIYKLIKTGELVIDTETYPEVISVLIDPMIWLPKEDAWKSAFCECLITQYGYNQVSILRLGTVLTGTGDEPTDSAYGVYAEGQYVTHWPYQIF